MLVVRPVSKGEPDLLIGNEFSPLVINDISGKEVKRIDPGKEKWTHSSLETIDINVICPDGWDAYLGSSWIGSSEV